MSKFNAKIFLSVFLLSVVFIAGCQQLEKTAANSSTVQTAENKSAPIRVSAAEMEAAEPALAADADGNLYAVYVAHGAEKSADVFLQKFDLQQKQIGEPVRVNLNAGEATAWRGDAPTIAIGADKTVYVGWTKIVKTNAKSGTDLYLSVSRDGGKTFETAVKVNDDKEPASHGMHSLAVGKNNEVFMAWLDERNLKNNLHAQSLSEQNSADADFQFVKIHHNTNQSNQPKKAETNAAVEPNSETFFAASTDGGKTFSANTKISSEVCPCCKTSLTVAPDGRIYASWRQVLTGDFRHIAVASSIDAGKTFSAPTIVSDDKWQINACPVSGAALAVGANSQLKVVWYTAGEAGKVGLYETESVDFAKTFAERRLISEGEVSGTPTLAANGGDLKVFWEDGGKVFQSGISANREISKTDLAAVGNLPSTVAVGGKIFGVYIKKETDKRAVWLSEL